ncbi:MAG: ABC transporter ATP-binding protein, partial [Acidimicrobiaceae bacterium]|nr:ABC transporter ATP-binding protein [Acidimicrobiaceae bacterium]
MRYVGRRRLGWFAIAALTVANSVIALLVPVPLAILTDNVLGRRTPPSYVAVLPGTGSRTGILVWVVVAGLAIFALASVVDALVTTLWIRVGQGMVLDLSVDTFSCLLRRSLHFRRSRNVGDSMARVTQDSWAVHTIAEALLYNPLQAFITVGIALAVMAQINVPLTLIAAAAAPAMVMGSMVLGSRMRRASWRRRETESQVQSLVQQTLSGISVVQAFGQEDVHARQLAKLASNDIYWNKRTALFTGFNKLGSGLATAVGTGAVTWFGAHQVLEHRLSVGELLLFLAYLVNLQGQLTNVTGTYAALQNGSASIERVLEVL